MVGISRLRLALEPGQRTKKLMIAAGRAAKGKGPLPPQLWKARFAAQPSWSEFDRISYRELAITSALQNVYDVVQVWTTGKSKGNKEINRRYAELVKAGIVGKDI